MRSISWLLLPVALIGFTGTGAAAPIKCSTRNPGHPAHLSTFNAGAITHQAGTTTDCAWAEAALAQANGAPVKGTVRVDKELRKGNCDVPSKIPSCTAAANNVSCCDGGFLTGKEPGPPHTQELGTINFRVCKDVVDDDHAAHGLLCQLPCQVGNRKGTWKFDTTLVPKKWVHLGGAADGHEADCHQTKDRKVGQVWKAHCHDNNDPGELVHSIGANNRECHIVVARANDINDVYTFVATGCAGCNTGINEYPAAVPIASPWGRTLLAVLLVLAMGLRMARACRTREG